jgi:hypothetical protein
MAEVVVTLLHSEVKEPGPNQAWDVGYVHPAGPKEAARLTPTHPLATYPALKLVSHVAVSNVFPQQVLQVLWQHLEIEISPRVLVTHTHRSS